MAGARMVNSTILKKSRIVGRINQGRGSCFSVENDRHGAWLLTAVHVVGGRSAIGKHVEVDWGDDTTAQNAVLVFKDTKHDIAVLRTSSTCKVSTLHLDSGLPRSGEVALVSFPGPWGSEDAAALPTNIITASDTEIKTQHTVYGGMSGGPACNFGTGSIMACGMIVRGTDLTSVCPDDSLETVCVRSSMLSLALKAAKKREQVQKVPAPVVKRPSSSPGLRRSVRIAAQMRAPKGKAEKRHLDPDSEARSVKLHRAEPRLD